MLSMRWMMMGFILLETMDEENNKEPVQLKSDVRCYHGSNLLLFFMETTTTMKATMMAK